MRSRTFALFFICALVLLSCNDYEGGFPKTPAMPVVNSMLMADSALSINLTWSGKPGVKLFTPIMDAQIEVLEDGESIGSYHHVKPDGTYVFNHDVKSNSRYDLNILVDKTIKLNANTVVPTNSKFQLESIERIDWEGSHIFELKLPKPTKEVSAIYIFSFLQGNDGSLDNYGVYCMSPLCDAFNRSRDDSGPENFNYVYDEFIRIPTDALVTSYETIQIASYRPVQIIILEATEAFDYYYKTAFWQGYYDPNIQLPFTWESIYLPSNINGGAGVFAGTAVTVFNLNKDPDSENIDY